MTTAHDMVAMLRGHLGGAPSKPEPGFFLTEVEAPLGLRRADALWLPLDSQRRGQLHGYEIKVSRSDVMAELSDPTKADAWLQYCDRWWLVVSDVKIIQGLTLPGHWGVLAPPAGRSKRLMTVVVPAPELKPATREPAMAKILTRLFYGDTTTESQARDLRTEVEGLNRLVDALKSQIAEKDVLLERAGSRGNSYERERVQEIVDAVLKEGAKVGVTYWNVKVDIVVQAILDHTVVRAATQQAKQRVDQFENQLTRLVTVQLNDALKMIEHAHVSRETSVPR